MSRHHPHRIDGTLTQTDDLHYEIWRDLLTQEDGREPITRTFYRKNISGCINDHILLRLFPEWPPERRNSWAAHKEAIFREKGKGKLVPLPGLMDFMHAFPRTGLYAVDAPGAPPHPVEVVKVLVTNAPPLNARFSIHELALSQGYFDDLVIVDEVPCRGKPDPEPYLLAMKRNGLDPESCLVFEDSCAGVAAGAGAHVRQVVAFLTTNEEERLRAAGAHVLLSDWRPLLARGEDGALKSSPQDPLRAPLARLLGFHALLAGEELPN